MSSIALSSYPSPLRQPMQFFHCLLLIIWWPYVINSLVLYCVLWEYSLRRRRAVAATSASQSHTSTTLEQWGVEEITGVLHQCLKDILPVDAHVRAPKSLLQITEHTHISQGIKLILLIERSCVHRLNAYHWLFLRMNLFWFTTITTIQVKIESSLLWDAQACMPSSMN